MVDGDTKSFGILGIGDLGGRPRERLAFDRWCTKAAEDSNGISWAVDLRGRPLGDLISEVIWTIDIC